MILKLKKMFKIRQVDPYDNNGVATKAVGLGYIGGGGGGGGISGIPKGLGFALLVLSHVS